MSCRSCDGSREDLRRAPQGDFRSSRLPAGAARRAEQLIYLENQFLWSPEVVDILADKLRGRRRDEFRVVVVLPAQPNNGEDDTQGQLGVLAEADDGTALPRLHALGSAGATADRVYVHAKVGIVDDRWLTIGSANLNEHSLFNDTEMNVVTRDPARSRHAAAAVGRASGTRHRRVAGDPAAWSTSAGARSPTEQLERRSAGEPLTHRLCGCHVSRRAGQAARPAAGPPRRRLGSPHAGSAAARVVRENGRDLPWRRTRDPYAILVSRGDAAADAGRSRRAALRALARALADGRGARRRGARRRDPRMAGARLQPARASASTAPRAPSPSSGWPDDLTELPGVGPYTAAAVACFAFGAACCRSTRTCAACRSAPAASFDRGVRAGAVRSRRRRSASRASPAAAMPARRRCPSRGRRYEPLRKQAPFEGSFRQRRALALRPSRRRAAARRGGGRRARARRARAVDERRRRPAGLSSARAARPPARRALRRGR